MSARARGLSRTDSPRGRAKVIGFDASPDMLAVARRNLSNLSNVEFREAAGDQLPVSDGTFDGVFANMFLHHAPDPARTIKELVRTLKPGGVICITDLDTHDHEWQREQMSDLWLGFERDDIRNWYAEAGLSRHRCGLRRRHVQCVRTRWRS